MNTVTFKNYSNINFAMKVSKWCKNNGLIHEGDYKWYFKSVDEQRQTLFIFKNEKWATLCSLYWSEYL